MASLEELGKFLNPFLLNLKKMELELTCPSCSFLLRQPTLLPCTHIVCSQCITANNQYQYECPVCITTFLSGDLRHFMHMEKIINIFKSLDDVMIPIVQKLGPQVMKAPLHVSDHNNIDGNIQRSQVDILITKVPSTGSPLSGQNSTEERSQDSKFDKSGNECAEKKSKEEVECDNHKGILNTVISNILIDGGGSELASFLDRSFADNAGKDHHVNREEPSSPPSLHDFKISEANNYQRSVHDTEGLSMGGFPSMDPLTGEAQHTRKPNDAKSPISVFSTETYDDVRETKRQKLNNEHKSDCDSMLPATSGHAYTEGSMKCAFCHLSKITEFTGPILHYANGKPVGLEELNQSKVKHFHLKCFEWAPKAFFEGEIAKNMESELARASKIKCSQCGQKGAALGCYVECCLRSYHLPCAVELIGCRWNLVGFNMLCPSHSSCKFPYELEWGIKAKRSLLYRNKSKTRKTTKDKQYSAQIDNSNLPEEQCDEVWIAEPGVCDEWVLCGSDLSTPEMELLNKFAHLTGASVAGMWKQNVTHVIASTNKNGACNRTRTVLMAILNGKWVLTIDWIKASMAATFPLSEENYEIILDCYGICHGPKKGRMRANQKAPMIFTGLSFYFSDQFERFYRRFLEEIVLAAGGTVLKNVDLLIEGSRAKVFSLGSSFIVYNEDPPQCKSSNLEEVIKKRCDEVEALVVKTRFQVIGHMRLLDQIAACSSAADLENAVVQYQ